MEAYAEKCLKEADALAFKAAEQKDFGMLEKSNTKRQEAAEIKCQIKKTLEANIQQLMNIQI